MKNNRLISDASNIGKNTEIGAFSIIEENVTIGDNCIIANNVLIKKNTVIGNNCKIHAGAIIGDDPQDIKFSRSIKSKVKIGNNNIIREYCTIHRSTEENSITMIGDNVILANAVQAAGFVAIDDNAVVGGLTPIHQFCKIGKFSFIGGGLRIVQDVPPYILANGEPLKFSGLNSIGLRRNNFSSRSINEIKRAYKLIFKSEFNISQSVEKIKSEFERSSEINDIICFIENSKRGLI